MKKPRNAADIVRDEIEAIRKAIDTIAKKLPRDRGRPRKLRALEFKFDSKKRMTMHDCLCGMLSRLERAESFANDNKAFRAVDTVRSLKFELLMITDLIMTRPSADPIPRSRA